MRRWAEGAGSAFREWFEAVEVAKEAGRLEGLLDKINFFEYDKLNFC